MSNFKQGEWVTIATAEGQERGLVVGEQPEGEGLARVWWQEVDVESYVDVRALTRTGERQPFVVQRPARARL